MFWHARHVKSYSSKLSNFKWVLVILPVMSYILFQIVWLQLFCFLAGTAPALKINGKKKLARNLTDAVVINLKKGCLRIWIVKFPYDILSHPSCVRKMSEFSRPVCLIETFSLILFWNLSETFLNLPLGITFRLLWSQWYDWTAMFRERAIFRGNLDAWFSDVWHIFFRLSIVLCFIR